MKIVVIVSLFLQIQDISRHSSNELARNLYHLLIIFSVREAFKKNNDETYGKFHILGGGGQQGVIFHMLSRKILNAQKAILSIFRHFYFFPLCTPPPLLPSSELNNENFLSIFGLLRGKNEKVSE